MDRDERWERVEAAYNVVTEAKGEYQATTATEALEAAYAREENDEFVKPTVVGDAAPIQDGDAVFFMNFRAGRAREMTRAFIDQPFAGFERRVPNLSGFVMLTQYAASFDAPCHSLLQISSMAWVNG